jgi:hypothetical protein
MAIGPEALKLLSDTDLDALIAGDVRKVSDQALNFLTGDIGAGEAFLRNVERGVTASMRGAGQLIRQAAPSAFEQTVAPSSPEEVQLPQFTETPDVERERQARMAREVRPVAGYGGLITGAVADPLNLIPVVRATNVARGIAGGATAGALAGTLEPTFQEFGDSRLQNIAVGTAFGGAVGGLIGKFFGKELDNISKGLRTTDEAAPTPVTAVEEPLTTPATFESPEVQRILEELGSTGAAPRQAALLTEQPPRRSLAEIMQREQARMAPEETVQQEAALLRPIAEEAPTGPTGLARVMQMEQQRLAEEQPNVGALLTKRSDDYFTQTARVADEGISTPKVQQLAKDTGQDIRTVLRDVKASDDVLKALDEANITQLPKTFDEAIDVLENTPSLRRILDACL